VPLARITFATGRSPAWRKAVADGVHRALVETFNVPHDDRFQVLTEHAPGSELIYDRDYFGIHRSEEAVFIQLTVSNTRSVEQKKALYRRIADLLADDPGVRKEDVFVNLVEVAKENWSFGNGEAQYA
jgi:4-oxalocrotonate tautomerase